MDARPNTQQAAQSMLSELSNAIVLLYKDKLGRGPTKARSNWAGEDTILVSLENTLTQVEQTMRELGEQQRLEETRLFFQNALRDDFVAVAERITGRKVRAFVSGMDADRDLGTEVFYFEPRS